MLHPEEALVDVLDGDSAVSEYQSGLSLVCAEELQVEQSDASASCLIHESTYLIGCSGLAVRAQVQACLGWDYLEGLGEFAGEYVPDPLVALLVGLAHSANVSGQETVRDELG